MKRNILSLVVVLSSVSAFAAEPAASERKEQKLEFSVKDAALLTYKGGYYGGLFGMYAGGGMTMAAGVPYVRQKRRSPNALGLAIHEFSTRGVIGASVGGLSCGFSGSVLGGFIGIAGVGASMVHNSDLSADEIVRFSGRASLAGAKMALLGSGICGIVGGWKDWKDDRLKMQQEGPSKGILYSTRAAKLGLCFGIGREMYNMYTTQQEKNNVRS